jgi:hypothetical protein
MHRHQVNGDKERKQIAHISNPKKNIMGKKPKPHWLLDQFDF